MMVWVGFGCGIPGFWSFVWGWCNTGLLVCGFGGLGIALLGLGFWWFGCLECCGRGDWIHVAGFVFWFVLVSCLW